MIACLDVPSSPNRGGKYWDIGTDMVGHNESAVFPGGEHSDSLMEDVEGVVGDNRGGNEILDMVGVHISVSLVPSPPLCPCIGTGEGLQPFGLDGRPRSFLKTVY